MSHGGCRAKPCSWNGLDFKSLNQLDKHLGKTQGYAHQYYKKGIELMGYPIIINSIDSCRRWKDQDLKAFYSYANARRKDLPGIGLNKMLEQFKERNKQ